MTWTPENNGIVTGLLEAEYPERLAALQAAKYGWWLYYPYTRKWDDIDEPAWVSDCVYRAKPAPKWEPPAELWALLRDDIVRIERDDLWRARWWGYKRGGGIVSLDALDLPDIPAEESLFLRPEVK